MVFWGCNLQRPHGGDYTIARSHRRHMGQPENRIGMQAATLTRNATKAASYTFSESSAPGGLLRLAKPRGANARGVPSRLPAGRSVVPGHLEATGNVARDVCNRRRNNDLLDSR